jgi:LysM repeat protein
MSQKDIAKFVFNLVVVMALLASSASLAFAQSGDQGTGTGEDVGPSQETGTDQDTQVGEDTQTTQALACSQTYVVQAGDSLSAIASSFYNDPLAFPTIHEATNAAVGTDDAFTTIDDPNLIVPGQTLCIPAEAASTTETDAAGAGMTDTAATSEAMTSDSSMMDNQQGMLIVENFTGGDLIFDIALPSHATAWVGPEEKEQFILAPGTYTYNGHRPVDDDFVGITPGQVEVTAGDVVQLACFTDSQCQLVPNEQELGQILQQSSQTQPGQSSDNTGSNP